MEFIADSLKIAGKFGANNLDPDSGYPKDWTGGIHAQDVYAEGKLGLGSEGELRVSLTKEGEAYFAGSLGIGTPQPATKLDVRGHLTLEMGESPHLYTGTGGNELNRYLLLLNSSQSRSASGLKAGGILISDSYDYANPGKNDLIVKGSVGIGTTNPKYKLHVADASPVLTLQDTQHTGQAHTGYVSFRDKASSEKGFVGFGSSENTDVYLANNYAGGSLQFRTKNGTIWMSATQVSFNGKTVHSSDVRLKHEIKALDSSLAKLTSLRGVAYKRKDVKGENQEEQFGLIAQEVEKIFPELVTSGLDGMKSLDYNGLIPVLVEAIKEQQEQIAELLSR